MAHFFMRMVNFIAMATFWKYIGFASFTRKGKDFLQVQREYCERLHNDIPRLEKCLKAMEASSKNKVLNKNQCVHLLDKLILAMKGINKMLSSSTEDLKFQSVFEELCYLQKKVEILEKRCTQQEQGCHSVVFQLRNKETFRELLLDLKCCYDTTRDLYLFHHPNQLNDILPIQFDAATYEQVIDDGQELKQKLELVLQGEKSEDYELAQHLLLRLRNLDRVDGGDLNALEVPNDFKTPQLIKKIGEGGYGYVYKSNWLGLSCATKVLKGNPEYLINSRKEAGILAGLSHPNLVQFFGCGITKKVGENPKEEETDEMNLVSQLKKLSWSQILKNLVPFFGCGITKKIDENRKEDETSEMHLVMELMETSLSSILKKAKRPLPYHLAIDIMHQIAKGVYYLHDMQVAHLDLKPDNVLSSSISMEDLNPCFIFKVTDYGTSQLDVCSNSKDPKPSMYTIGTRGYMSPEVIKGSKTPLYPFQADVWSFAMICSEILSGKAPYSDLKPKDFYDQMKGTHGLRLRPDLPNDCEGLTILIQECWSQDPLQRPTFSKICERLTSLKKSFLKGGSCALRDSKSMVNHIPRVDAQISPLKEIPIDLDHQLAKAKRLLKMKYIGIVGMGGIGKTTLAKALLGDVIVTSSYDASCFVAECKNYHNSYEILCEILSKLGNDWKPKNLGDAQEMMKELLIGKKVFLILDDVNKESLVHDIVPPHIVQASKGTTIIITTRQWSTIKSFVGIEGRLDVEFLHEKAATTLFTSHLCLSGALSSPDFVSLCKHVVDACNGLPLSLKVMGAFLHSKERLRSWERALQRMARGKSLDGDEEIWNTLQISFDGLNDDIGKRMFLDMACFFCRDVYPSGISKAMILSMWSKNGILPVDKLERLIDLSLLKVNGDSDILEMHDQLRDMGRMIAKDTRIWKASMVPERGFSSKDVEILEGISLQGNWKHHAPLLEQDQSFDFEKLRVLILGSPLDNFEAHFYNLGSLLEIASQCSLLEAIIIGNSQNLIGLPHTLPANIANILSTRISNLCGTCASLKVLDLVGLKFLKQLPNEFASSNTLLRLNLSSCSSLLTLPKEVGNMSSLMTLNLSSCLSLTTLPKEVGNLSSMTTLDLCGCSSLVTFPKEVGNLSSLINLNLSFCSSLVALPKEVGKLSSLNTFDLHGCSNLTILPKEVGNLTSLTTLHLKKCSRLVALPKKIGNLSSLATFDLSGCSSLAILPKEVENLTSLITLNLSFCSSLATLPNEVGNLSSLTTLDLSRCSNLVALPKEVGKLSSLTTLHLKKCSRLAALPKELGNLSSLETLNLNYCSNLSFLPMEVGNLLSLATFDLSGCSSLAVLPKEVGNLSSLTTLHLRKCSSLGVLPKEVGNLYSLSTLDLSGCSSLASLPKEVENLSSLITLDISFCSSLAILSKEVGSLSSLTTLYLKFCSSLTTLPKEVGRMSSLTILDLDGCLDLATLPKEIGNLSLLTTLNLSSCSSLVALPKEIGNLSSLTTLYLSFCSRLASLPKNVGRLSFVTTLGLKKCTNLATLPKEVKNLSSLINFDLNGCSSLVALPKEVGHLSSLTALDLCRCSSLVTLPKELGNLSSLTTLNLSSSSLVALPKEVENLSSLFTLNLSCCSSLVTLPKEVGSLSSLTTLNLSFCSSLASLPKEMGNLSSLTIFNLSSCSSLAALPDEMGNLSSLTTLNLSSCSSFVALPKEIGNLSPLTTLNLNSCSNLVALPKEVGNLYFLTTLNLSSCSNLVTLPTDVGKLCSLTTLNLWGCSSLASLPKEVGNLSSLTTFNLSGCTNLAVLPNEVGNLSFLKTLHLSFCSNLTALPKEVENLSSLTTLNLKKCTNLATLPKEVGNLSSLNTLDLSGCSSLASLPKEVGNLSSLTTLYISFCSSLATLPKEVGNLSSLTTLYISFCSSLGTLPKEVGNLSSLSTLDLSGCSSLAFLPKEVGNLSSLSNLDISGCSRMLVLPKELGT